MLCICTLHCGVTIAGRCDVRIAGTVATHWSTTAARRIECHATDRQTRLDQRIGCCLCAAGQRCGESAAADRAQCAKSTQNHRWMPTASHESQDLLDPPLVELDQHRMVRLDVRTLRQVAAVTIMSARSVERNSTTHA